MKISIITVVLNAEETIADTIASVLSQTYDNIEYIVIDGGSKDNTVNIIKTYEHHIYQWISEPDKGIYHAMNKGISLATGDVIGILNSDDIYADRYVIKTVAETFKQQQTDSLYGNIKYVTKDLKRTIRFWRAEDFSSYCKKVCIHIPHPAFFVKRSVYQDYGKFNLAFIIAADYELIVRFIIRYCISSYHVSAVFVKMRIGGSSNKSIVNIYKGNLECYKAWRENDLTANPVIILVRPLVKVMQFFRS